MRFSAEDVPAVRAGILPAALSWSTVTSKFSPFNTQSRKPARRNNVRSSGRLYMACSEDAFDNPTDEQKEGNDIACKKTFAEGGRQPSLSTRGGGQWYDTQNLHLPYGMPVRWRYCRYRSRGGGTIN